MAMMPPVRAPQGPAVLAMPPQKPVAILGIKSDSMLYFSATAERTLSAQNNPDSNSSPLRSAILFILISSSTTIKNFIYIELDSTFLSFGAAGYKY